MPRKNVFEYVHASQVFDDNNDGFVFGVNWLDKEGDILDCSWFKTEKERKEAVKYLVGIRG